MEISTLNQTAAYLRSGNSLKNTAQNATRSDSASTGSPAYKVTISSESRSRSLSEFNRSQVTGRNEFKRGQKIDAASNNRVIERQKQSFERKQSAEEQQFEARQSMEKSKFMHEIRSYGA